MNENEINRALEMKDKLNKVGCGFCLAKWDQVTMHLHTGMTHSCHHPAPHKIPLDEVKINPKAIHNSKQKREERIAMLRGERPDPCNYCYNMEDTNPDAISDRYLKSANLFANNFDKIKKSKVGSDYKPSYIEVSFSNACNLKCTYCGPTFSSKWQQELENNSPITLFDQESKKKKWNYHDIDRLDRIGELPIPHRETNPYVDAFWTWWPELKEDLKYLRVTGGEPLMSKDTFNLLKSIQTEPMPELDFSLNTNLNAPEKNWNDFIDFVKKHEDKNLVKKLTVYTSLDGWGKQAEYIRTGLDFNMLWERLLQLIEEHPTVNNTIMSTYSFLSIPTYKKFLQEILNVKRKHNKYNGRFTNYADFFVDNGIIDSFDRGSKPCVVHLDISTLTYPTFMSVAIPPREFTMPILWDQYDFMMKNLTAGPDNKNFYDFEAEKMGRVVDYAYYAHQEKENYEEMMQVWQANWYEYVTTLDARRNTSFVNTFPEFESFYYLCRDQSNKLKVQQ